MVAGELVLDRGSSALDDTNTIGGARRGSSALEYTNAGCGEYLRPSDREADREADLRSVVLLLVASCLFVEGTPASLDDKDRGGGDATSAELIGVGAGVILRSCVVVVFPACEIVFGGADDAIWASFDDNLRPVNRVTKIY